MKSFIALPFALLVFSAAANAKDHDDGTIAQDPPANIADTFAFVNPVNGKIVLGMTVNPLAVPGEDAWFSHHVLYQIKIDNDGDLVEDLVFQATFGPSAPGQQFELKGPAVPVVTGTLNFPLIAAGVPVIHGAANATVISDPTTGTRMFAGLADYPDYVDMRWVESVLSVPGSPTPSQLEQERDLSGSETPGIDAYTGFNVSALMIETGIDVFNGSTTINVWSTTSRRNPELRIPFNTAWSQIDRQGRPLVNTLFVPTELRDVFNLNEPKNDVAKFSTQTAQFLESKAFTPGDINYYLDLARNTIFPDVLTLDTTNPNGLELVSIPVPPFFAPSLNGRAPRDDSTDLFLALVFDGQIIADLLPANDCTPISRTTMCNFGALDNGFPTSFPFLGPSHAGWETILPRN